MRYDRIKMIAHCETLMIDIRRLRSAMGIKGRMPLKNGVRVYHDELVYQLASMPRTRIKLSALC
jgi:hypothetical protein